MAIWWESLTVLERILLYTAVPATLILLIQTILLFVGGNLDGSTDASLDTDGDTPDLCSDCGEIHDLEIHNGVLSDGDGHAAAGLHILTVRGVVAFFALFGWGGLWLLQTGLHPLLSLFLAIQFGIIGMVGIALLLREASKLQYDGTLNMQNVVGSAGTVYLTIPVCRSGAGKVNILVQEQLREFEAVTDRDTPIPYGTEILVVDLLDNGTLLVTAD